MTCNFDELCLIIAVQCLVAEGLRQLPAHARPDLGHCIFDRHDAPMIPHVNDCFNGIGGSELACTNHHRLTIYGFFKRRNSMLKPSGSTFLGRIMPSLLRLECRCSWQTAKAGNERIGIRNLLDRRQYIDCLLFGAAQDGFMAVAAPHRQFPTLGRLSGNDGRPRAGSRFL